MLRWSLLQPYTVRRGVSRCVEKKWRRESSEMRCCVCEKGDEKMKDKGRRGSIPQEERRKECMGEVFHQQVCHTQNILLCYCSLLNHCVLREFGAKIWSREIREIVNFEIRNSPIICHTMLHAAALPSTHKTTSPSCLQQSSKQTTQQQLNEHPTSHQPRHTSPWQARSRACTIWGLWQTSRQTSCSMDNNRFYHSHGMFHYPLPLPFFSLEHIYPSSTSSFHYSYSSSHHLYSHTQQPHF